MKARILIVQGHPDCSARHLCHVLARAYADGARGAGHAVDTVEPARLDFPLLRSPGDWERGPVPAALAPAQQAILDATHLVLVYPLWLGEMPALTKGFLEQVARPGFAIARASRNPLKAGLLGGRSARVIVTMGMPAPLYRLYYRAHSLKALKRNILGFAGIRPVRTTLVGGAASLSPQVVERWCRLMREFGVRAR